MVIYVVDELFGSANSWSQIANVSDFGRQNENIGYIGSKRGGVPGERGGVVENCLLYFQELIVG